MSYTLRSLARVMPILMPVLGAAALAIVAIGLAPVIFLHHAISRGRPGGGASKG